LENVIVNFDYTIDKVEGIYVLRDDLYPGGTKARFITNFMKNSDYDEFIYPGTSLGAAIVALGYAAKETKKQVTVFITERKEHNDIMQEAFGAGCGYLRFEYVPMGFYPKIKKAAERYSKDLETPNKRFLIQCGVEHDWAIQSISEFAKTIRESHGQYDYVVSACSSGTLQRGLQKGELGKQYLAVATGQKNISPGVADVVKHYDIQKFESIPPKEFRPPFPTVLNYDGKCWKYCKELIQKYPDKRILLWNVWANKNQRDSFENNNS
jgi:hypothetical protein